VRFTTTCVTAVAVALLAACSPGAGSAPVGGPGEVAAAGPLLGVQPSPLVAPAADDGSAPATLGSLLGELVGASPVVDDRPRPRRQWDHVAEAGAGACREELAATGAKFQAIPDRAEPDAKGCGIPHGVVLTRGPTGIRYAPPLSVDCSLARKLAAIEAVVQEEAATNLGSRIHRIGTLGTYACRGVVGRRAGWSDGISEHSFGNAIDVARFEPEKGRPVTILRGYEAGVAAPTTREGRFLLAVARRLRREAGVRVLGPDFDASHRDHFHVDAGLPRWR
jgi:hypothetical protein